MNFNNPLKLICPVKNYPWGKIAQSSLVFEIAQNNSKELLDRSLSYAELWMGAHPNASAEVEVDEKKVLLSEIVKQDAKEVLGEKVYSRFGNKLPFLMKVLSIGTALSIQAHPDKKRAKALHAKDPKNYPDENHKPEMGFALTKVEILYGFRALGEILDFINQVEELSMLIPSSIKQKLQNSKLAESEVLHELYSSILNVSPELLKKCHDSLINKLSLKVKLTPEEIWIKKLAKEYPNGDVGIFSFFILQYLVLQKDEAIFIGPNIVHAYLSGDVVECMATSDNVVRSGLTPKFKDVSTLLEMLDCKGNQANLLQAEISGDRKIFKLPTDEFFLEVFEVETKKEFNVSGDGPLVLFCSKGSAVIKGVGFSQQVAAGEVFFLPAPAVRDLKLEITKGRIFIARTF